MTRVDILRVMLPPARHIGSSPLRCAWRSGEGAWQSAAFDGASEVSGRFEPRRVEVCPHPADVSMTQIELPPLATRRMRTAVLGAVELLALSAPADLALGFGPRNEEGMVPVAWMSAGTLSELLRKLKSEGLAVHAVLPPPAFLPMPRDEAGSGGASAALVVDDWLVVRTGACEGALYPMPSGCVDPAQIEARLDLHMAGSPPLRLLSMHPVDESSGERMSSPWTGSGWNWSLPTADANTEGATHQWLRPLLGWTAAAVAVWVVGLNLYASRVAAQGQMLTRQMAAQVKAAYPEVPVVLNPLQQARQLRDARRAGTAAGGPEPTGFAALVRASTGLLAQAEGQVLRLDFRDDRLEVRWRDGAAPGAKELVSLQEQALVHGLEVQPDAGGLRIRAAATAKGDGAAPRPAGSPERPDTSGALR